PKASASEVMPRPAASVILLRDGPGGMQVFMMRRSGAAVFVPGNHVFPGGAVDADDNHESLHASCCGFDDGLASRILGVERGGLGYWVAAIRECFEEAGLLLAGREPHSFLDLHDA